MGNLRDCGIYREGGPVTYRTTHDNADPFGKLFNAIDLFTRAPARRLYYGSYGDLEPMMTRCRTPPESPRYLGQTM
jgi:hypothetical protein